jgi:hypothetical protein
MEIRGSILRHKYPSVRKFELVRLVRGMIKA